MSVLTLAFLLPLAAAPSRAETPLVFPAELVTDYTTYPAEPPYCAFYRSAAKSLVFLAARHGTATLPVAERLLGAAARPEAVVIEMRDHDIADAAYVDKYAAVSEPHYAAKRTRELDIPVVGGEPRPEDELAGVVARGFDVRDYEGFYVIRTVLGDTHGRTVARIVSEFEREFGITDRSQLFTERGFREWYRAKDGKPYSRSTLAKDEAWPVPGGLFSQKVAAAASRVRNARIGRIIAEALNAHDRVLVVYGAGHQVELGPALEKMLGRPEIGSCP